MQQQPQSEFKPIGESLSPLQKWALLGSLMMGLFLGALDQTIVSTATPRILSDLGGFNLFSWMFTGYMLSSTVIVPLVGKLSDIYGRKPFLIGGMVIFLLGSAACGAAWDMTSLIFFRVFQGIGGGLLFASVFATTGDLFSPVERGKYMGIFTGTFSLASIIGPTLGGLITDSIGWRWIFYLNVPVGLIAIPAVWITLPSRSSHLRPKIDYLGAALLTAASVSALLALTWAGNEYAWSSPQITGLFAFSALALAAFFAQEVRHPSPVIPLHLFRNREFLVSNLVGLALGVAMFGLIPYLPTFVQVGLDASATASGVITTPQSVGVLLSSVLAGQIMSRTGKYKILTITGGVFVVIAMSMLFLLDQSSALWHVSAIMVVLGLGMGAVLPPMSVAVQNAVSYQYLGVATSASQFFRQIGGVFGTAIVGSVLARSYRSSFASEVESSPAAAIPTAIRDRFGADPTTTLDERQFGALQEQVLALPGGSALLESVVNVQRIAISEALHTIAFIAIGAALACLALAFALKGLPLRTHIGDQATPEPPPPTSDAPAAPPTTIEPDPAPGAR